MPTSKIVGRSRPPFQSCNFVNWLDLRGRAGLLLSNVQPLQHDQAAAGHPRPSEGHERILRSQALATFDQNLAGLSASRTFHLRDVAVVLPTTKEILEFVLLNAKSDTYPQDAMVSAGAAQV